MLSQHEIITDFPHVSREEKKTQHITMPRSRRAGSILTIPRVAEPHSAFACSPWILLHRSPLCAGGVVVSNCQLHICDMPDAGLHKQLNLASAAAHLQHCERAGAAFHSVWPLAHSGNASEQRDAVRSALSKRTRTLGHYHTEPY